MSSQAIGQRLLAMLRGLPQPVDEVLTFSSVAYNVKLTAGEAGPVCPGLRLAIVTRRVFLSERSTGKK